MKISNLFGIVFAAAGLMAGCAAADTSSPGAEAEKVTNPQRANCKTICNKYQECYEASTDVKACVDTCANESDTDGHYKVDVENCAKDVSGKNCSEVGILKSRCSKAFVKTATSTK